MTISICSITTAKLRHVIPLQAGRVSRTSCSRALQPGQVTAAGSRSHVAARVWRSLRTLDKHKCAQRGERRGRDHSKGTLEMTLVQVDGGFEVRREGGGEKKRKKKKNQRVAALSLWCRATVRMNHRLYVMQDVSSGHNPWRRLAKIFSPHWCANGEIDTRAGTHTHTQRHTHTLECAANNRQCLRLVWWCSPLCRELLDTQPVSAQMTTARHFFSLQTQSSGGGSVSPRCDGEKRERGRERKREREAQCVQWRRVAHVRCPCSPSNFFLKPYSQSVTG